MITKLKRRFAYWLIDEDVPTVEVGREDRVLESNYIRIDVYRGDGGLAVETSVYNKKKDTNYIGFHILHDDKDLENALSKIITVESIKAL
jgi:hypothetical protein